jgi:hypothetical protein
MPPSFSIPILTSCIRSAVPVFATAAAATAALSSSATSQRVYSFKDDLTYWTIPITIETTALYVFPSLHALVVGVVEVVLFLVLMFLFSLPSLHLLRGRVLIEEFVCAFAVRSDCLQKIQEKLDLENAFSTVLQLYERSGGIDRPVHPSETLLVCSFLNSLELFFALHVSPCHTSTRYCSSCKIVGKIKRLVLCFESLPKPRQRSALNSSLSMVGCVGV